jgi:hypothetical protein
MRTDRIEMRLEAIENRHKESAEYILDWATPEGILAHMLSNGMETEEPGVFELHWEGDHSKTDAQKIRWIRHLPTEKLDKCRQKWKNSDYERDRIALGELERLQAETILGKGTTRL